MIYKTKIVARYAETDRMGIVHHGVYPIWFEEIRSKWINENGVSYGDVEKRGILLPLVDLHCHYYKSCDYMDTLTVTCEIIKLTCSRMTFHYEVFKGDELITTGETDHAWVSKETFRVINIKKTAPDIYAIMKNAMEA